MKSLCDLFDMDDLRKYRVATYEQVIFLFFIYKFSSEFKVFMEPVPGRITPGYKFCYLENVEVTSFCLFDFCLFFDNEFNSKL